MQYTSLVNWRRVDKERDGFPPDDTIFLEASWGGLYVRVNDHTEWPDDPEQRAEGRYNWVALDSQTQEFIAEQTEFDADADIASIAAEIAVKAHWLKRQRAAKKKEKNL